MIHNINSANNSVKAGFVGYGQIQPIYISNFANQPDYTANEQKLILAGLSDRAGVDEQVYADDKPYAYKLMEETGVDNTEVISLKEDMKSAASLTTPPEKDDTKEVLINGALVVLGVIVLVKLLS